MYDTEALYQDADIEMWEMSQIGNAIGRAEARGVCCHTGVVGYLPEPVYPEQVGLRPGQSRCRDGCGTVFYSDDDWITAMMDAIS